MDRQTSFTYEELLACGRGELFGPGNAQLPFASYPDVSSRITLCRRRWRRLWQGAMCVPSSTYGPTSGSFLAISRAIRLMPGCLGLDALWQMVGFHLGWLGAEGRGRALGVGEVKFADQVLPSVKKVVYGVESQARLPARSWCSAWPTACLEADGKRIYEAKDLRVGLFKPDARP